jgi:cyanate permease
VLGYLEDQIQNLEDANDLMNAHYEESTAYLPHEFASAEAKRLLIFFEAKHRTGGGLTREKLATILHDTASSLDQKRTWPLTLSMLLVGSFVGIVTPAMPFLRANRGLTAGEYGFIVSAFALAKMTGNNPFAVFVERHEQKVRRE